MTQPDPAPPSPLPVVGVMGSGSEAHPHFEDAARRARKLGAALATLPVHLLTGGGGGLMTEVSRAYAGVQPRRGSVLAVLPGSEGDGAAPPHPPPGYPNPWVEIPIRTHLTRGTEPQDLPRSRNPVNILTSDVVLILAGSEGTASEAHLALAYGRPVLGFMGDRSHLPGIPDEIPVTGDLEEVLAFVRQRAPELR